MAIDTPPPVYVPGILKGSISSPNGIDLPGDSKELNADISNIIASTLKYTTPSSPIVGVAGPLHASLVARYPRAHSVRSQYFLSVKSGVNVEGLSKACTVVKTYLDDVRYTNTHKSVRSSTVYNVITVWHLPIFENSLEKTIDITIKTTEHLTPSICDLQSKIVQSQEHSKLGQIHPTFDVHLKAAERALPPIGEGDETAPLRLSRLVFDLADEQSPCKRIDRVKINMKISGKKIEKPSADSVQIFSYTSIDRDRYEKSQNSKLTELLPNESHRVYIALGSNVGDRIANIESACQQMHDRGIKVTRTSALYETKAMYMEDQESFINGACEVSGANLEDICIKLKA